MIIICTYVHASNLLSTIKFVINASYVYGESDSVTRNKHVVLITCSSCDDTWNLWAIWWGAHLAMCKLKYFLKYFRLYIARYVPYKVAHKLQISSRNQSEKLSIDNFSDLFLLLNSCCTGITKDITKAIHLLCQCSISKMTVPY